MAKTLKEIFGLREMAINVPDADAPALRKIVDLAVQHGQLPPDAKAWFPRDGVAGTPATGTSVPAASTDPKAAKAKGKKTDPKGPVTPRAPIPVSADARAAIDKSGSAWDKLGGAGFTPPPSQPPAPPAPPAKAAAPAKPGMFDPGEPEFDSRSQGGNIPGWDDMPAPQSAAVPGAKKPGMLARAFGQKPKAEPQGNAMEPKQSKLKKIFSKKPVKGNPADDDATSYAPPAAKDAEPVSKASVANAARKGRDWVDQDVEPDPDPQVDGSVENPFDDMKNLAATYQKPDAQSDLDWDLKRSPKKGKAK